MKYFFHDEDYGQAVKPVPEPWHPANSAPENVQVMTKIDDGTGVRNEQKMTRKGNLWWINLNTESAMYVYYRPTHWRFL